VITDDFGLMYVPAGQTVVPSQMQAVAPAFGILPVPQAVAGELRPAQAKPEGQGEQAVAPLFTTSPATQPTGAAEPPAHEKPDVQVVQYGVFDAVLGLMYVPAVQIVELSHSHAVAPAFGAFPEPQAVAGELPPVQ
jgi:hypothetical protein